MTLAELIDLFRQEARDQAIPPDWPDAILTNYANEAQLEAARRARLLTDSTGEVSRPTVKIGANVIALDRRVIFVRRVKLDSQSKTLPKIRLADLDQIRPDWENDEPGDVVAWCPDYQSGTILLIPPSAATDRLRLSVIRDPLEDMADPDDEPEIAPRYHRTLVQWMLYRAFSKQDTEYADPKKAAGALAAFEQEFGPKSTALDETWVHEKHGYDDYEGLF